MEEKREDKKNGFFPLENKKFFLNFCNIMYFFVGLSLQNMSPGVILYPYIHLGKGLDICFKQASGIVLSIFLG